MTVAGKDLYVIKVCWSLYDSIESFNLNNFSDLQPIVKTHHALVTEVASRVNVFVKQVGKEKIVEPETSKFINVCQAAPIMVTMSLKPDHVSAIVIGLDMIVHKLFAVWIVDRMEYVNLQGAVAMPDGRELYVNS